MIIFVIIFLTDSINMLMIIFKIVFYGRFHVIIYVSVSMIIFVILSRIIFGLVFVIVIMLDYSSLFVHTSTINRLKFGFFDYHVNERK